MELATLVRGRRAAVGGLTVDDTTRAAQERQVFANLVQLLQQVPLAYRNFGAYWYSLKARLKAEGLFDAECKRPLPGFPRTVGIVTSPTGAVIRDFLNIVARRHSGLSVLVCPVSVQGDSAPAEVEALLARAGTTAAR